MVGVIDGSPSMSMVSAQTRATGASMIVAFSIRMSRMYDRYAESARDRDW